MLARVQRYKKFNVINQSFKLRSELRVNWPLRHRTEGGIGLQRHLVLSGRCYAVCVGDFIPEKFPQPELSCSCVLVGTADRFLM